MIECVLVLVILLFMREELRNQRDFMLDVVQHVKSISQTSHIFGKAKNVDEAVASQVYLEGEQKSLAEAEDILEKEVAAPGKLVGFYGQDANGHKKKFTFAVPPPDALLQKIPKERLIYESISQ